MLHPPSNVALIPTADPFVQQALKARRGRLPDVVASKCPLGSVVLGTMGVVVLLGSVALLDAKAFLGLVVGAPLGRPALACETLLLFPACGGVSAYLGVSGVVCRGRGPGGGTRDVPVACPPPAPGPLRAGSWGVWDNCG